MDIFFIDFVKLLVSFVLMIVAADILIKGAILLSERLSLPKAFVGAVFVGLGTSAPELFTSLYSAFIGEGVIAAGNVIGSNIFNSTLVMGACLLFPFSLASEEKSLKNIVWILVPGFLVFLLIRDGSFGFRDGLFFLIPLPFFLYSMASNTSEDSEEEVSKDTDQYSLFKAILFVVFGAVFLALGSRLGIQGSLGLVDYFGIPKAFAGAIIIAAGTGLPELVTTLVAGFKKETELAFSNIVGSNALNVFAVLGLSSLFFPFSVGTEMVTRDSFYLGGITVLLLVVFLLKNRRLQLLWSGVLLILYLVFFSLQLG